MSTDWSSAYRLSGTEFVACWDRLGLGDLPVPLELRRPGVTAADRAESYRRADTALAALGLADVLGRPLPALAEALRLVAAPGYECDLRCTGGVAPGLLIGLGSVRGPLGVVTLRHGEHILIRPTPGARVAALLVEVAGPLWPQRLPPAHIPAADFDAAVTGAPDLLTAADRLAARGIARGEADLVAALLGGITSGGQLGATATATGSAGEGGRRRGGWVIGYHRSSGGACAQLRRPTRPYGETVTITPTTPEGLLHHLDDLIRATTGT